MNNELTNSDNFRIKDFAEVISRVQKNIILMPNVDKLDIDEVGNILSGIVEVMPYFNKVKKIIKFGHSIIEKFNDKKQFIFLFQLQNGILDEKGLEKRNQAYKSGKRWYYNEV